MLNTQQELGVSSYCCRGSSLPRLLMHQLPRYVVLGSGLTLLSYSISSVSWHTYLLR